MSLSPRQTLELDKRHQAAEYQVADNDPYDVPFGHTPDEQNFPRRAASFHKLLEHESSSAISAGGLPIAGLLTQGSNGGVHNYHLLREGLELSALPVTSIARR
jgi:hypothetical protein